MTAPRRDGWVATEFGWMEDKPIVVVIKKINEIIDFLNKQQKEE